MGALRWLASKEATMSVTTQTVTPGTGIRIHNHNDRALVATIQCDATGLKVWTTLAPGQVLCGKTGNHGVSVFLDDDPAHPDPGVTLAQP